MKLLRTIRLEASDTFVFDQPAEPGEWAVSGAFAFWGGDPTVLEGKARTAFRSGFLGVSSLGWSTLVHRRSHAYGSVGRKDANRDRRDPHGEQRRN